MATAVSVVADGVEYRCTKRGILSDDGRCFTSCVDTDVDFFAVDGAVGSRCFTNCYYQLPA